MVGTSGHFGCKAEVYLFFTVAAPEKINFDTELPLYKQITILSNNLICAKPTENSLKNQ